MPVPTDFSIPYIDLELTTPDDIKIKAFLLLQRTVLNMGESPIESGDGLPSDEEVRQILWEVGGYSSPRFAVCGLAANGAHVPRQRWEPRASHPIGQDLLWQDALQRHHAFISRARVFSHFLRPFPPAHILSVVMATLRARRPKRVRRQGPRFLSYLRIAMPRRFYLCICAGLQVDAQTVLDYVRAHPILSRTQIVRLFALHVFFFSDCKSLCRYYMVNPSAAPFLSTLPIAIRMK